MVAGRRAAVRIEITRSGGFGGLTRTWNLEVSRSEAEQRWLPLAAEVSTGNDAVEVPGGPAGRQRDRFIYRITIGYTEVHLPEGELDDPWRELIDRAREATSARQAESVGAEYQPVEAEGVAEGADPEPPRDLL